MNKPSLVRFYDAYHKPRVGVQIRDTVYDAGNAISSVADWLQKSIGRVYEAIAELNEIALASNHSFPASTLSETPQGGRWLPPIDAQDVWAAGVTYERSREARQSEAFDEGDVYARVYSAERPEIFFKACGSWVVGHLGKVGIRHDARWNVPEPELGLLINPALEIVGLVAGNDMSSRDIEGENPLYLPQAKIYTAACALGLRVLLQPVEREWPDMSIQMKILRQGAVVFEGETHTTLIRRKPEELVRYLGRCMTFPNGVVLLTGTGLVPPDDFTLIADDEIQITIPGIGTMKNCVYVV